MAADPAQGVNPSPVPTAWMVGNFVTPDGRKWYLVSFTTPVGTATYWFEGEGLDAFANALRKERGGVVVPPSSEVRRFARELKDSHGG